MSEDISEAEYLRRTIEDARSSLMPAQTAPDAQTSVTRLNQRSVENLRHYPLQADVVEAMTPFASVPDSSPLFWVDPDFSDLVLESARQLATINLSTINLPAPHGDLVFARSARIDMNDPLRDDVTVEAPVRVLRWRTLSAVLRVATFVDVNSTRVPGLVDGWADLGLSLSPLNGTFTPQGLQPVSVLAAFSLLFNQPGLAMENTLDLPSRPAPKTTGKKKQKRVKPPRVRVIGLRPGTEHATAYDSAGGRTVEWRHRWMVRGHWRNQPYPSLGEGVTKPVWIAPYLKGPDGAPVLTTPKVIAVRGTK